MSYQQTCNSFIETSTNNVLSVNKMVKITWIIAILAVVVVVKARDIYSDVRFYYDPESQMFVTVTITKCYLVTLTHVERDHIHSRGAIEDVEMKMMRDWLGILPETRIFFDDQTLSSNVHNWCVKSPHDIFRLERKLPTTVQSIIG